MYLIWSNEHRGWWRPKSCGYTKRLHEAGTYTREEALKICANARDGWGSTEIPSEIPVLEIDALEAEQTDWRAKKDMRDRELANRVQENRAIAARED